jgi:hypothetical protein
MSPALRLRTRMNLFMDSLLGSEGGWLSSWPLPSILY